MKSLEIVVLLVSINIQYYKSLIDKIQVFTIVRKLK